MPRRSLETATGRVTLTEKDGAIAGLTWGGAQCDEDSPLLRRAIAQLEDYFAGRLQVFDLPLEPAGNGLQQAVWREMRAIPFGETRTYGEIATAVGNLPQPVGQACGANPIPVLIPCHRVVAAGGGSGGFSAPGGLETKYSLLKLEGARFAYQPKLL
ncbi:MAG: methylated-DNA--[protein]-cysteine S-methyltransferase [Rhodovibrionaceae bacterium]